MGTKQVRVDFLVVADDQVSASATITVGGVQKWTGDLANTNDSIPDASTPDNLPYSTAEFDLEVDNFTTWADPTTNEDFTFSVTRGTVIIKHIQSNYTITSEPVTPPTDPATFYAVAGNVTEFIEAELNAQPTWNDQPYLNRYNFASGPGPLPVYVNELLACSYNINKYNDHLSS